jgi:hypothetical protein
MFPETPPKRSANPLRYEAAFSASAGWVMILRFKDLAANQELLLGENKFHPTAPVGAPEEVGHGKDPRQTNRHSNRGAHCSMLE